MSFRQEHGDLRVLVVEDNFVVALELVDRVEALDAIVDGPHATVHNARDACVSSLPDAAILDVQVRGGTTFELGEWLATKGVAVMFVTGYSQISNLPDALAAAPRLRKPIEAGLLEKTLFDCLGARRTRDGSCR